MGLLDRLKNAKAEDINDNIGAEDAEKLIEYALDNDVVINYDTAMKICALNNGVMLISETIASLPVHLYKDDENGVRTHINDSRCTLLNLENSVHSTAFNMKKKLVIDYIMNGNAYLDINKVNGQIKSLINIDKSEISISTNEEHNKRNMRVNYSYWGMHNRAYHEVLNLVRNPTSNEYMGVGVLREGAELLGTAKGLENYCYNTVNNGFYAKGVIESEKVLSKPTRNSLSERIKRFFSGSKNAGKVLILDDGMKFKSLALTPVDLELLKQREFTINDIARLLNLPPSMIGGTGNSMTYTNVQDTQLQFLQTTIEPYLTIIENTFNKYLLTEQEKSEGYYFEFDTINMLRSTPQRQIEMLTKATGGRQILTVNEARNEMNYGPLSGGDVLNSEAMKGGDKSGEDGSKKL